MCIWRQCNKDPSAALGMTVLGERIGSQGRLRRLSLEDGILVSQPSPLGEGAPQGRIGHRRYERQMRKAEQRGICGEARVPDREWQQYNQCFLKNHSRPFLWKGQTSEARRGWLPRMWEYRYTRPTSAPSGHLLPKEGGRKKGAFVLLTKAPERR